MRNDVLIGLGVSSVTQSYCTSILQVHNSKENASVFRKVVISAVGLKGQKQWQKSVFILRLKHEFAEATRTQELLTFELNGQKPKTRINRDSGNDCKGGTGFSPGPHLLK